MRIELHPNHATPEQHYADHLDFLGRLSQDSHPFSASDMRIAMGASYWYEEVGVPVNCCPYCLKYSVVSVGRSREVIHCEHCDSPYMQGIGMAAAFELLVKVRPDECVLLPADFEAALPISVSQMATDYVAVMNEYRLLAIQSTVRALELLMTILRPGQRRQFVHTGNVLVKCPKGNRYYICYARHGNVLMVPKGERYAQYAWCGHYGEDFPIADQMITQILTIEQSPEDYTSIANPVKPNHFWACVTDREEWRRDVLPALAQLGIKPSDYPVPIRGATVLKKKSRKKFVPPAYTNIRPYAEG